ncbi:Mediator of DNA damage checkpoint protein 1 [Linnemannia elongata]|nr:Mediator of DNA damage checkpoint protein 1 [Linnemannia elongata]
MRYKLAGVLTLSDVRRLTEAEQEEAPRKGYISPEQQKAIENGTHLNVTFVGEGPTEHNTQPLAPPIVMPSYYTLNSSSRGTSYNSRSASAPGYEREGDHIRAPSDHSFDSTQRIEDLTQVVREEGRSSDRRVSLPPALIVPGAPADVTLPRPNIKGGPGCFNAPSKVSDDVLRDPREYFEKMRTSSQPKDIHYEATLVISDDLDDASQSSVILPETQPTQLLAPTSQDLAPSSLPEDIVVSGRRPSVERQREDADDADDADDRAHGSRSGSVVPESPVPSQQDYIPSTPAELIGLSRTGTRDTQERERGEDEEDEDRVPQTPVEEQQDGQKQHTAMSDVSTLEANQLSASIPDSQVTQEAIRLSLSSDDQPQHHLQEDTIVKTEEVESERHLLQSVDSQNVSLSSPGAVKAEDDDDEGTKVDEESKPLWRFGKEVCPDSQHSTQSSREEPPGTSTSTTTITTTNITFTSTATTTYQQEPHLTEPQASEQEMLNTEPYHSSQDSDRTASREGSPKHNLETDAAPEEPPKPAKQIKVESTDDVSTAATSRLRRGPSAARLKKSGSVDSPPVLGRSPSLRSTRSTTGDHHSIMISSPGWERWKKMNALKDALSTKHAGVYNDEAHMEMSVLVFNPINGRRTCKLMCAIARGVPIVTDDWLKDSISAGHCLPTEDYLFEDEQMEEDFNFSFRDVCAKGRSNVENGIQIFKPYEFYCITTTKKQPRSGPSSTEQGPSLTDQGYLVKDTVRSNFLPMIKICGGKVLSRTKPDPARKETTIIIGQNVEDCSETQMYIADGFKVMDKEFVLSSILLQSPELDFETHAIPVREVVESANAEEDDDAGNHSDSTTASNTKSARSRSRSTSVVPSMSRSSSSVRPQRSSSTLSTSSTSSAVTSTSPRDTATTGKKRATKKK